MALTDEQTTSLGKEVKNSKSKVNIQNILNILLIGIIIIGVIAEVVVWNYSSLPLGAGFIQLLYMLMIFIGITFGIIFVLLIKGVYSLISFIKNRKQSTLLEEKSKNKWYIFDIISFLVVPTIGVIYSIGISGIKTFSLVSLVSLAFTSSVIYYIAFFLLLASGIKTVIKNKEGTILSRISGWFLIIVGLLPIFIYVLSFSF